MSKTWFKLTIKCHNCGQLHFMRIFQNAPPLCPNCGKQMNKVEEEE